MCYWSTSTAPLSPIIKSYYLQDVGGFALKFDAETGEAWVLCQPNDDTFYWSKVADAKDVPCPYHHCTCGTNKSK